MQNKKQISTILAVLILIGVFVLLRSVITGGVGKNIKDADFLEDSQTAYVGCTPPTLSNVAVGSITSTDAVVSWTTNQASTSAAKIGLSAYTMAWMTTKDNPASTAGVTNHTYTFTNLTPNTTYYYRVRSSNGSCQNTSNTYSFTTTATVVTLNPDTTAPGVVTGLAATNITSTSLTLSWDASVDPTVAGAITSGNVQYEVYGPAGACAVSGISGYCGLATSPSIAISGLSPSTTYSGSSGTTAGFTVLAYDGANNYSAAAPRLSVTTLAAVPPPDTTTPTVSLSSPVNGATVSGTITLTANASDNVGVTSVGFYRGGTTLIATDGSAPTWSYSWNTTTVPNGSYSLTAKAYDAAGNIGTSSTVSITVSNVVADTTPPTISSVSGSSITTTGATISWSTNEAATGIVDYGTTTSYGQTVSNTNLSTGHSATLSGLTSGTTYHYRVKSADSAGNIASSVDYTFSTNSPVASCPNDSTTGYKLGMWEWKNTSQIVVAGSQTQTDLFNFTAAKNVDTLYLYTNKSFLQNTSNASNLRTFLNTAWNTHCLKVVLLDGAADWMFITGNPYNTMGAPVTNAATDWINAVITFNSSITGAGVHPVGVRLDTEPHGNDYWNSYKTQVAQAHLYMLDSVKAQLVGTGLQLSTDVARWFDTATGLTAITYNGQTKNFMKHIFDRVDVLSIMDYVVSPVSAYNDALNELQYGQSIGKPVIIGLETIDLTNYGGGNGTTSFYGTSCTQLNSALAGINTSVNNGGYASTVASLAIHMYKGSNNTPAGWTALCP